LSIPERTTYCVTGSAEAFATAAATWLGQRPTVHGVNLQSPARIR
jgi:glutamate racemase